MPRTCAVAMISFLLLGAPARRALADADEPGATTSGAPDKATPGFERIRLSGSRAPLSLNMVYNKGFHEGLGWSGIIAGPQLLMWSYPFYNAAITIFDESCTGSGCEGWIVLAGMGGGAALFVAILATVWGVAATTTGIVLVAKNHISDVPTGRLSRAHGAGFVKGMGLGLMAQGALNVYMAGMFLGYQIHEAFGDRDTGKAISWTMLALGGAQVVGGGIMALAGHYKAAAAMTRLSVAPVALPGGAMVTAGWTWD